MREKRGKEEDDEPNWDERREREREEEGKDKRQNEKDAAVESCYYYYYIVAIVVATRIFPSAFVSAATLVESHRPFRAHMYKCAFYSLRPLLVAVRA